MSDTYSANTQNTLVQDPSDRLEKMFARILTESEVQLDPDGVVVRRAIKDEGALLWEIARDAGGVDLNSPYAYMMQCRNFYETCVIAEVFGTPAGFVTAHRVPNRPQTLFVWQVAVLPEFRGLGIGKRMLDTLADMSVCGGVRRLEATVTPSNKASEALFSGFAKDRNAELEISSGFDRDDFPDDEPQEQERLFVVQPIRAVD